MISKKDFANPGVEYRGADLWMLNDALDDGELRRQIGLMKEAGCGAFIARTFFGLISDYPGGEFKDKIRIVIDAAKQAGLKVILQAGYMPCGIPGLPGRYAHKVLKAVKHDEPVRKYGLPVYKADGCSYFIEQMENHLDLLNEEAVSYYMETAYLRMWKRFEPEFGKTVQSVWVDEPFFDPSGLPWSERLPEVFAEMWGYALEGRLPSLFFEEGNYRQVRYHYWRTVLEMLKGAYFSNASRWCAGHNLKFSGHLMGEDTLKTQIGYTVSTMPFYKYMDIPGIDFLTGSPDWFHGTVAGIAGHRFVMAPLQCSSAAHQAGKDKVLCEMYGVSSEGLTFEDQKYIFDYFAALGVNTRCVHALYYSLRGRRKRKFVPHISYQQPYWKEYRTISDYCARVGLFMRSGKPSAEVLVLHPIESAYSEYEPADMERIYSRTKAELEGSRRKIDRSNYRFSLFLQSMLGAHIGFELGDEDTLTVIGEALENGRLKVGCMTYGAVVLPWVSVIRQTTKALLDRFAAAGGAVYVLGDFPSMVDGRSETGVLGAYGTKWAANEAELIRQILTDVDAGYEFVCDGDSSEVWINARDCGGRAFFLFNGDRTNARDGVLRVHGTYKVREWLAGSGEVNQCEARAVAGYTEIPVRLEAGGSRMFLFQSCAKLVQETGSPLCFGSGINMPRRCVKLPNNWSVKRMDPNVMLLDFCRFKRGGGEYSGLYPMTGVQQILEKEGYKGSVTLKFMIEASSVPGYTKLAAEDLDEYDFVINGNIANLKKADGYYIDKSFKTADITGYLKPGSNTIEATRRFEPLESSKSELMSLFESLSGVELEAMYLIGDFGVFGTVEPTHTGCVRFGGSFTIGAEKSRVRRDLTIDGYPFYAGTVLLENSLYLDDIPFERKAVFSIGGFRACSAHVRINGTYAGNICWKPYEVDVTGLLKKGENKVQIELTNTLRNLLGPHHRPSGEPAHCWGDYPWTGGYNDETAVEYPEWYEDRMPDTVVWTESYMQVSFGINDAEIYFL